MESDGRGLNEMTGVGTPEVSVWTTPDRREGRQGRMSIGGLSKGVKEL